MLHRNPRENQERCTGNTCMLDEVNGEWQIVNSKLREGRSPMAATHARQRLIAGKILRRRCLGVLSWIGLVFVNASGFLDHSTHSGRGCGAEWPLCHGALVPHFVETSVTIEYVHRALSLSWGIALAWFFIELARDRHDLPFAVLPWVRAFLGLLLAEALVCTTGVLWTIPGALLGALPVLGLGAQAVLLVILARSWSSGPLVSRPPSLVMLVAVAWAAIYVYAGGWMSYPHGELAIQIVHATALGLAFGALIWAWTIRGVDLGVAVALLPWLGAPFITEFTRPGVWPELGVVLWLSWNTGVIALLASRTIALPKSPSVGIDARPNGRRIDHQHAPLDYANRP